MIIFRLLKIYNLILLLGLFCQYGTAYCAENDKNQIFSFPLEGLTYLPECEIPKTLHIATKSVKHIDLTGDSIEDVVEFTFFESNINKPFTWTIKIIVKNKCVFMVLFDDLAVDNLFYGPGCETTYEDCKRQYYFSAIESDSFIKISPGNNIFIYDNGNSNLHLAEKFIIEKFSKSAGDANLIAKKIFLKCHKKGAMAITLPGGLIKNYGIFVWADDLQGFVLVHEE